MKRFLAFLIAFLLIGCGIALAVKLDQMVGGLADPTTTIVTGPITLPADPSTTNSVVTVPYVPTTVTTTTAVNTDLLEQIVQSNVLIETTYTDESGNTVLVETGSGTICKADSFVAEQPIEISLISYYRYYVLTNLHVISEAGYSRMTWKITLYDGTVVSSLVTYIDGDESLDLALLSFFGPTAYTQIGVADVQPESVSLSTGEPLLSVGCPNAQLNVVSNGAFLDSTTIPNSSNTVIAHNCTVDGGSSGGALYNANGVFVGLNTWKIDSTAYAVTVASISQFLTAVPNFTY